MSVVTPVNPPLLPHRSPPPPTNAWSSPNTAPAAAPALSEGVRVRLLRAAHGDPRAAAELAAVLTPRQLTGLDPLPVVPPAPTPTLLRAHRRDVRALPDDTRFLLLLAAADQYPLPTHAYERAVTAARLDTRPLDTAEAAGLAHTTARGVVFRDAWTRIAVYESASTTDRREAHRLLAAVLGSEGERPGRSWHRAAAALGPSRRLAAELRLAARLARAIGDRPFASALAERAAGLTPEPAERAPLLAQAAAEAWQSGDGDRARRLVAATDDDALGGLLALRAGNAAEAFDTLLAATVRHAGDPTSDRAAHLLARATEAAIYTGDLRRCREAATVADGLGILPPSVLGALTAAYEGRYDDARDVLEAAAGRCGPGGDPTELIHSGIAALLLGDHTRAYTATARAAASARARGETVTVPQAMEFRAYAEFWTGRPKTAEAAAVDALRQAYATGQDNGACHLQAALAMFAALTGDETACRERAQSARAHALERGLGLPAALAMFALAFLDLSTGRYAASAARLRALAGFGPGHGHRAVRHLAIPHYVEAAVRTGDTRVAVAAHADYDRWARTVRSSDDLALSARCRALLATGEEAVEHYRTAVDLHASGIRDFERARTELLFGSALRRLRNRTEARDRLHSALEAFDHFGSPHCASQARAELRALGERATVTQPAETLASCLTAQQLLIARMAADGATNREIAARLLLSPRTIDHHLRGVFARLGIRSRIELVRLLTETNT